MSIPGIGKLTAEVKTVEASEPSEVPVVNTWEAEEQGTKGNNEAKSGNYIRICTFQQELKK